MKKILSLLRKVTRIRYFYNYGKDSKKFIFEFEKNL